MRVQDIFESNGDDDVEMRVAQLRRMIADAKERAQWADNSSREQREIMRYQAEIERLLAQQKETTNPTLVQRFTIPDTDSARDLFTRIRDEWKAGARMKPWEVYSGNEPGTLEVVVKGDPSVSFGGITIGQIADMVKQYQRSAR